MLTFFFILAVAGLLVLAVHIILELNALEKNAAALAESLRKRYEGTGSAAAGQPKSP
jgi:hypothetical protein